MSAKHGVGIPSHVKWRNIYKKGNSQVGREICMILENPLHNKKCISRHKDWPSATGRKQHVNVKEK